MKARISTDVAEELRELMGDARACFDSTSASQYTQNVCGSERRVQGVVYPRSRADVRKIVRLARREKIPLYPISAGKNWGLGARLPVEDHQLIVDLGQMNRILEFDPRKGTMVIEPGVTQGQIEEYLRKRRSKYQLNVTGSARESSVVGNALERGVAHYGCRASEILGLQVVLGTGEVLNTGSLSVSASRSRLSYPFGLGADLRGLFFQSSFGIVTQAVVRLMPVRKTTGVVSVQAAPGVTFKQFVDALSLAKIDGLIPSNLHVSNRLRRLSVVTPLYARELGIPFRTAEQNMQKRIRTEWAATASFSGDHGTIQSAYRKLKARLRDVGSVNVLFKEDVMRSSPKSANQKSSLIRATRGTFLHACGVPSDDALLSLGFAQKKLVGPDPVKSGVGTLFLVPLLPFDGANASEAIRIVKSEFRKAGFKPFVTLNLVEDLSLEAVINLVFDRGDKKETRRAHDCVLRTFRNLQRAGFPPQRMSIFQMPYLMNHSEMVDRGHREAMQGMKRLFDPDGIIAPGRYDFGPVQKGRRT